MGKKFYNEVGLHHRHIDEVKNHGATARTCVDCGRIHYYAILKNTTNKASTTDIIPTCPDCGGRVEYWKMDKG